MKKNFKPFYALIFCFMMMLSLVGFPSAKTKANAISPLTIYFNANGGSCETESLETDENGKLSKLPTATYSNYVFMGWFLNSSDTTPVTLETTYSESKTLIAKWASKTHEYEIATNGEGLASITGKTNSEGLTYSLGENISTNEELFSLISNDLAGETSLSINFNNFVSLNDSPISLNYKTVTVTGKVSSSFESPTLSVSAPENDTLITMKDLTIESNSCAITFTNNEFSGNVIFETVNLVSTNNDDYGFDITGTNLSLTFRKHFTHTNKKLFHFINGLNVTIVGDHKEGLSSNSNISATLDYDVTDRLLMTNFGIFNNAIFTLLPTDDFYVTESNPNYPNYYGSSKIKINYNTNGGAFKYDHEITLRFPYKSTALLFPVSDDISNLHYDFVCWLGKLTLTDEEKSAYGVSQNEYYFNKTQFLAFIESGYDMTKLDEIFATQIDDISENDGFTKYAYDETEESIDFLVVKFFISQKKTPTFIAKYSPITYSISFETNGGTAVAPIYANYGEVITVPEAPTKTGYTFVGWFSDEDLSIGYSFSTMTDKNPTLYAKWEIKSATITFVSNNGTENSSFTDTYGSLIEFPSLSKTGHSLEGWYTDALFTNKFTSLTTPDSDITLYANWTVNYYYIYLNAGFGILTDPIYQAYGTPVTAPESPTNIGYDFFGWYTDTTFRTPYVFSTMPAENITIYAQWLIKEITISFETNCSATVSPIKQNYGTTVSAPITPTNAGYKFIGWFSDEDLTTRYEFTTMPEENIKLYAKWEKKSTISITANSKTTELKDTEKGFSVSSSLSGFVVEYLVDGTWTTAVPTKIGKYDVRIYRAEDETYAEFSQVLSEGYIVTANTLNLSWLVILLFAFSIFELVLIIIIRKMRKDKAKNAVMYSVAFTFGVIPTSQFVLIIIGALIAIFGFVMVVYELVKLHKTNPEVDTTPSAYDNQATIAKMTDKSEDKKIDSKVDALLNKEFDVDLMQRELQEKQRENDELLNKSEDDSLSQKDE